MRARDYGIQFEGLPGALNAITDVPGLEVGHKTLIQGDSVRTGVTAIHPRGKRDLDSCFAGWFSLNGNGEMTGTVWLDEAGILSGPVLITNTHSVGVARDETIAWQRRNGATFLWSLPVVAETYDGYLNDIDGFHVKPEHVSEALDHAAGGPVPEGSVGGGTGMVCYGFKGGIGTSSRVVGGHTVGVLVQANHGDRRQLRLPGMLVGPWLGPSPHQETGSIIIVVATDLPLLPHQCRALSKRAAMGLARTGAIAGIYSGDIFLAFSTGNVLGAVEHRMNVQAAGLDELSAVYEAVAQATEEAIWNVLVAAESMHGFGGHHVEGFPRARLSELLSNQL